MVFKMIEQLYKQINKSRVPYSESALTFIPNNPAARVPVPIPRVRIET